MTRDEAMRVLATIDDPEMPISIVDLGIVTEVRAGDAVEVDLTPTFVGCPALDYLESKIVRELMAAGATEARVRFVNEPVWSIDRISAAGRESLRQHGVTVPRRGGCGSGLTLSNETLVPLGRPAGSGGPVGEETVACPFCGSVRTHMESPFGPTRCRSIFYCDECRNGFEHMKPV